jgi:uncharacterized Tic20 family protein
MSGEMREPASGTALPATPENTAPPATRSGPTAAERILAAVAHLLMMLSVPGVLLAAAIWLTQRKRSPYVAGQARTAVIWQIIGNVVVALLVVVLVIAAVVSLGGAVSTQQGGGWLAGLFGSLFGLYVVLFAAVALFFVTALIGAWRALRGKPAHYPFVRQRT